MQNTSRSSGTWPLAVAVNCAAAALEQRDQQRVHRFGSGHAERVHALPKRRRRGHTGDAERLLKERIAAFAFDCFEVTLPFGQQTDVTGQDLAARQTLPHRKPRVDGVRSRRSD